MSKKLAKIIIEGVIQKENETYKQKWLLETIEELSEKKNVAGIMLYINSPGGAVYESDEVYEALLKYKKETNKPVYAYFSSLAASGGYYIGCAADKIIANRNALTGSIGVIASQFIDLTELMKKYGVKSEIIHAGKNKTMGSITEPVTDEQRAIMQSIADECYEQFTKIVADSRKLELSKVKELADGRIYTANQAKNIGLVDEVLNFDDAVELFEKEVLNGKEADVKEYKVKQKKNLVKMLKGAYYKESGKDAITKILDVALKMKTIPFPAYIYEQGL